MAGKIKKRITHFRQYKGLIRTVPSAVKQRGLLPNVNHLPEWGGRVFPYGIFTVCSVVSFR